jgi:hypothetical protein
MKEMFICFSYETNDFIYLITSFDNDLFILNSFPKFFEILSNFNDFICSIRVENVI